MHTNLDSKLSIAPRDLPMQLLTPIEILLDHNETLMHSSYHWSYDSVAAAAVVVASYT